MSIADQRKSQFQDRLGRIAAGGPNTTAQYHAGPAVIPITRKGTKADKVAEKRQQRGASLPVSLISGLLIGTVSVLLARYARFQLNGGALSGPDADILMGVDIIVAVTFAIFLRAIFRFQSRAHGAGKLIGVVATVLLMHNAVHIAPGLFERGFSVTWVDNVVSTTKPNSVLVAGVSIAIKDFSANEVIALAQ